MAACTGNARLFRFFAKHFLEPLERLPAELYNEGTMRAKVSEGKPFQLSVPRDYVDGYEQGLHKLKREIDELQRYCPAIQHETKQVMFWLVRAMVVAAAWAGSFRMAFLTSLLQFVVMPYSCFVAISYGLETIFVLYSGHIVVFPALTWLLRCALPASWNVGLVISPKFVGAFLAVDQLLCALCLFWTPGGRTQSLPWRRILESVVYGFLNCKTYWLVLLPLCFDLQIPLLAWCLDATLGLSSKISSRTQHYWEVLFYHVHRMAHLRHVYQDAHKFHHYLHDCTAFDAHIFGSGAPEEWLILMCDILLALGLGVTPASLSYHVLSVSWFDKWSLHSRTEGPALQEENFHADHHARHVHNYGFYYPYELLMKTALPEFGNEVEWSGFKVRRHESERVVNLFFTPISECQR